jgi:hypothetical protein
LRYGTDKIIDYDEQLETLVGRGFALWDIVQECERKGSLDTDIIGETPNPIREFCDGCGSVRRIVIANGTTGGKFFVKHFKDWFTDGGIVAAGDEMSKKVLKVAMNSAKKGPGAKNSSGCENAQVIEVVCLPSVSTAAAKFSYLEKREVWNKGCFEPGLADYDTWKNQNNSQSNATPTKTTNRSSRKVTPSPANISAKKSSPSLSGPSSGFESSDIERLTPQNGWIDLKVSPEELRPSATLTNGQCFNWMVVDSDQKVASADSSIKQSAWGTHDAKEWIGPLGNRVFSIRETPTSTLYRVLHGPTIGAAEDLLVSASLFVFLSPCYYYIFHE